MSLMLAILAGFVGCAALSAAALWLAGKWTPVLAVLRSRSAAAASASPASNHDTCRRLVEHSTSLITTCDAAGRILFHSPAARTMLGLEPADLLGRTLLEFAHPDDHPRLRDWLAQITSSPGSTAKTELRHRTGDGDYRWLELEAVNLLDDPAVRAIVATGHETSRRHEVDARLRESELRFKHLAENIPGAIFQYTLRPDGTDAVEFMSDGCRDIWGVEAPEVREDCSILWKIVHPEDLPALQNSLSASGRDLKPWIHSWRITTPRGQSKWLQGFGRPRARDDGGIVWNSAIFDITETRRMAVELEHTESRLTAFLSMSPLLAWIVSAEGRFVFVNDQFARLIRGTPQNAVGRPVADFFSAEYTAQYLANNQTVLEASRRFETIEKSTRLDGSPGEYLVCKFPIVLGDGTRHIGGVAVDVTDQRSAEATARESAERLRLAIEASSIGLWDWDLNTNRVNYSPEWKAQLGYEDHEIADEFYEWESRVHPDDIAAAKARATAYAANPRGTHEVEFRMRHKDGSWRWIYARGEVSRDTDGTPTRMRGCHIDITERKRGEERRLALEAQLAQAQKLEAIGRLAGGVAHDFNNLLTVIRGYGNLLRDTGSATADRGEMLSIILEAADRAAALTRQLLTFSRREILEPRVLSINTVIAETDLLLRRLIGEDIRLVTLLRPDLPAVRVDPGQMSQVILNLSVNARDAMPDGGVLTIETDALEITPASANDGAPPGRYVAVLVRDTGLGISPEIRGSLFEPFFTTKGPGKGTGLGLATTKAIAEQCGGWITVDSEPGAGSTFKVFIPACDAPVDASPQAAVPVAHGSELILLVEDDDAVRTLLERFLEQFGYRVLSASGGQEAIDLAARHHGDIDLIISDVVMPDFGGRQLVEHITRARPGIKVLYVSGYTDDAVVRRGVSHADVAFLAKPFSAQALATKVREVLDTPAQRNP